MKRTDIGSFSYPSFISGSDKAFSRQLINHVRDFIIANKLDKIVIACSGGHDSTCLVDICHKVSIIHGTEFKVVYVNHGLRREENEKEIELIKSLPVSSTILNGEVKYGGNLEARAREIRYFVLGSYCETIKYNCLFVAHNADEDLETMIMRLADNKYQRVEENKSFQRVVYGIRPHSIINGLHIYRPLLPFTKMELARYNNSMGIRWCEDTSNESLEYKRNVIRHKIMPTLKTLNRIP